MNTESILSAITQRISELERARALLTSGTYAYDLPDPGTAREKRKYTKRKSHVSHKRAHAYTSLTSSTPASRAPVSAASRARIARAQKLRWKRFHADKKAAQQAQAKSEGAA